MNIKDHFCLRRHLLPAIALYTAQKNILAMANIQTFTSQSFGVVGPLAESLDFSSPLGFDVQTNSNHKTQKNQALLI